jgi:hypothetical protein
MVNYLVLLIPEKNLCRNLLLNHLHLGTPLNTPLISVYHFCQTAPMFVFYYIYSCILNQILKEQRQNKIVKPLKLLACLTRLSLPSFLHYAVQFVKPLELVLGW